MLIAVSDGLPRDDLASRPIGSVDESRRAAESVLPGLVGEQLPDGNLAEDCYPSEGIYAGTFGNTWVVASQHQALYDWAPPFDGGRNAYRVFMQSVVSAAGFAYWGADGSSREFGGSWEDGAPINGGENLPFELPFWAGERDEFGEATELHGSDMPFNPMDLGEEALRAFFGFVGEGVPGPGDLDAFEIGLHGFALLTEPRPVPTEILQAPRSAAPPATRSKGLFSRRPRRDREAAPIAPPPGRN